MSQKPIQIKLQGLVSAAEERQGLVHRVKLTNNLLVEVLVQAGRTKIQISRSTSYPCQDDWMQIVRWFPYPIPLQPPKQAKAHGRHYLTASWPTPARLVTDRAAPAETAVTKLLD